MRHTSLLLLGAAALAGAKMDLDAPDPDKENTYFDGKAVPPMIELRPDTFEEAVTSTKFMLIKHYSPYCPHCIDYAPTYQTLYEFYYTSQPEGTDESFTKHYDFHFASVNCIAFYDLCSKHNVQSYPTTILYKDGAANETMKGVKTMKFLSDFLEPVLEAEHPGSRPASIALPNKGAKSAPKSDDSAGDAKTEKPTGTAEAAEKPSATAAGEKETVEATTAKVQDEQQKPVEPEPEAEPTTPAKAKTGPAPNQDGISFPLNSTTFPTLVTNSDEPWFIKFYAPWCGHCQAMAPNWQQMAKVMKGKLNVGEVDCTTQSKLCSEMNVKGFPTLLFFQGVDKISYSGLRGLGDFVRFAEDALELTGGVPDVTAVELSELEKDHEVIFIYFYDHATTDEDFMAVERLPLSLVGHARIVKTKDPVLFDRYKITTWPRLLVSREGRPTYYTPITPREMRDVPALLSWMQSVWLPIVPELNAANAREVMEGKIVVLGVLNPLEESKFSGAKKEMKSAATEWMDRQVQEFQLERQKMRDEKQMRIDEAEDRNDQRALRNAKTLVIDVDKIGHQEVVFAWVDGGFWDRWIRSTYGVDVQEGERIIINDEDNRRYWDTTATGNYILASRTSILETLEKIMHSPSSLKPKYTISSFAKIFFDIRMFYYRHSLVAVALTVFGVIGCIQWYRGRRRLPRYQHYMSDDKESFMGSLTSNGKVD